MYACLHANDYDENIDDVSLHTYLHMHIPCIGVISVGLALASPSYDNQLMAMF